MLLENRINLYQQLKVDEGCVESIYLDHLGYPTFGIGHLITKNDPEYGQEVGTPVSSERVIEAFDFDCELMIDETKILFDQFDTFPGEVQEILVNMMFNMGRTRLSKFKNMIKAINENDWKLAAIEGRDSRWHKQVSNRAERLMSRLENV